MAADFDIHVSAGSSNRLFVPSANFTSTVEGSTICRRFAATIRAPCLGSLFSYFASITARSSVQLLKYQPRQNHDRSSPPSLSIVLKKSEGEGCLNAQSRMYLRKAQSNRSFPRICSRSSTLPYAPLKYCTGCPSIPGKASARFRTVGANGFSSTFTIVSAGSPPAEYSESRFGP